MHAEGQTPSVRSVNKLKQSINKAEGSQLSSEVLQESKTVLTKLETQIDNVSGDFIFFAAETAFSLWVRFTAGADRTSCMVEAAQLESV